MPVVIKSRERVVNAFVEKLFVEWNDVICLLFGSLCIIGAIRDWDWLCDPTGKPHACGFPHARNHSGRLQRVAASQKVAMRRNIK